MQLCWGPFQCVGMLSLMYVWWMILGINCARSLTALELGAGSSPRKMASSRPVATNSPSNVQTLCTAKPSTTTVTRRNMVTPLLMVADGTATAAALKPPFLCLSVSRGCQESRAPWRDVGGRGTGVKHSCGEGTLGVLSRGLGGSRQRESGRERKMRETRPVLVAVLTARQ